MTTDYRSALASSVAGRVSPRPGWEIITLLVTVKAYPAISKKSGESVCIAGIRLDTPQPEWVRLFPVGFRALPSRQQFKKYQVVTLRASKRSGSDQRPESFQPDLDTLTLGPLVDTDGGSWKRRWEIVEGLAGMTTTCALYRAARTAGQAAPSLGLVKPRDVDLTVHDNPDYLPGGSAQVDVDLFGNEREVLEKTPFIVTYHYRCADSACKGHHQQIVDWESGQLARSNLQDRSPDEAKQGHRARFLDDMCSRGRDTYFFVGNQHQYPSSFLVLGLFWPKRNSRPQPTLVF